MTTRFYVPKELFEKWAERDPARALQELGCARTST